MNNAYKRNFVCEVCGMTNTIGEHYTILCRHTKESTIDCERAKTGFPKARTKVSPRISEN